MASRGSSRGSSREGFGRGGYQGGGGRPNSQFQIYNPKDGATQPDPRVTELENKIVAGFKNLPQEVHKGNFPPRRGFGTVGEKTLVRANHFPLVFKPGTVFYRYQIRMSPDEKKKATRRRILDLFIEEALSQFTDAIVTDGGDLLFAIEDLPLEDLNLGEAQDFKVKLWWKDDVPAGPHERAKEFLVKMRKHGSMTASKLTEEFVMGQSRHREHGQDQETTIPSDLLQIFNIILNREPETNTKNVGAGKNKFFHLPSQGGVSAELGGGLEAVQGFYKSVRPSFGRVLCNINPVASPFYREVPLVEAIGLFLGRSIVDQPLSEVERKRFSKFISRIKVTMKHLGHKPVFLGQMSYKNANEHSFLCSELDREITVRDYFRTKYRLGLRYPNLQLIQSGRIMLPLEVCSIAPGQLFRGPLSEAQTTNMIRFACRDPTANAKLITGTGLKVLNLENNKESIPFKFGVKVDPRMVVVPARILSAPTIRYQGKTTEVEAGKGQWNLRAQKFVKGATITRLLVLAFMHARDRAYNKVNIETLVAQFQESAQELGLNIKRGQSEYKMELLSVRDVQDPLEAMFRRFSDPANRPDLLLCILPDELKQTFNLVKYYADMKAGIPTACMLFSKVSKGIERGNKQYWANLLMKINARLGGLNHALKPEALKPLLPAEGPAMLVGMDVTHPSALSAEGAPSIAAMVASCDADFANYPCSLRIQPRGEMICDIEGMLMERLAQYKRTMPGVRGGKPPMIIIYRDGVSEGEFGRVLALELPKIIHACDQFETGYRPKITLIVVGKRHHTRFYPVEDHKADDRKNCLPGTVYDWDFYLQAHKGLQGTTKPAHYYVLKDENGFNSDSMQQLVSRCVQATRKRMRGWMAMREEDEGEDGEEDEDEEES
ncbi:hypothetical protein ABW21_db0201319 [Orbilia brochopaga]|nr:hypothetical protein ABW21_db0201319 [Drechslerella brochopaga]